MHQIFIANKERWDLLRYFSQYVRVIIGQVFCLSIDPFVPPFKMMFLVILINLQAVAAVKEVFTVSRFLYDVIWIPDDNNHFLAVE